MTDEGTSPTETWVEDKGQEYPYAYDKGGKLKRWFGVKGIPAAILIDPTGAIVWRGHPGSLKKQTIKENLEGAVLSPIYDWPGKAKSAKRALKSGNFSKALSAAEKLGEDGAGVAASLRQMIDGRLKRIERLNAAGDYLQLEEFGESTEKAFAGLPEGDKVSAILDELAANKEAQQIIKAQQSVCKLISGKIKKAKKAKLEDKLRDIAREYPDTAAARDAEAAIVKLRTG